MTEIRWWERVYFGVITVAALFVTWLGFFKPARMDESFTWAVLPPLHARFVGALYLFGGVYMLGCAVARYLAQVRPAPLAVVLFTSLLLLITLLNPDAFDYDLGPPKVWTGSYVVYPLLGLVVIALMRRRQGVEPPGPVLPAWGRWVLLAQAAAFGVSGLLLLVARDAMVDAWPWPIDVGLAQFYGGPFVALAWCAFAYSRERSLLAVLPIVAGTLAFAIATLVVSLVHLELFSADDLSSWVWFGGFAALTVALGLLVLVAAARPQADFQGWSPKRSRWTTSPTGRRVVGP